MMICERTWLGFVLWFGECRKDLNVYVVVAIAKDLGWHGSCCKLGALKRGISYRVPTAGEDASAGKLK